MYTYIHACIHTCACMQASMHTHTHTHTHTQYIHTHTYTQPTCMHTLTHACTHTYMIKGVHATRLDWKRLGKASMVGVINVGA